jgi:tetratricopeptide (TPR) repeat protein
LARRLDDPAVLADVLVSRHYTIAAPTTLVERAADAEELQTLAEGVASPVVLARAHWLRFRLATETGDLDKADQCLKRFTLLAAELGQPAFLWMDSYARAGRALLAGQLQEAESISFKGHQIGRSAGQPDAPFTFITLCFQIRLHMGELEAAGGLLDEFVNRRPELPFIASMRALLLCDLGKTDETQCILDRIVQDGCSGVSFVHGWLMTMTNLAAVCARQGDVDAAATIRSKLAPFADQVPGVTNGAVTLYLGLLARTLGLFEEAEQYFMAASSIHARFEAPVLLTRTQIEFATLLLARRRADDFDKAQQLLRQALRTVRDLRLIGLERQITPHLVGEG